MCKIETVWTPEQFVQEVQRLEHPFDRPALVPPSEAEATHALANLGSVLLTSRDKKLLTGTQQEESNLSMQKLCSAHHLTLRLR